jgi:hypothetical protein
MAHPLEAVTAAILLLSATAVATGYVNLPYAALSSPFAIAILVIASLGAFAVSPAVGLSAFLLTAVLLFKRNVQKTFSNVSTYGESSIMKQHMGNADPYATARSGPRSYPEFQETNPTNPMLGPKIENFATQEPAPYGDEQGSPVDGQFPKEAARASSAPEAIEYNYRPDASTGDNTFTRFGPDLDEKKKVFAY